MKLSVLVLLGFLLLLVPALSLAAQTPVELSMVVTGTITVNPDGSVKGYAVDDLNKLPPLARRILRVAIPVWEFVPIMADGKSVAAKTGMAVRVMAHMIDAKHAKAWIASATFGCQPWRAESLLTDGCQPHATVEYSSGKQPPPRYPIDALWAGGEGMVYLVVEVGRQGHVIRAAARQVNLYHQARRDPAVVRKALAKAAETAALKWEFRVPTVGPEAARNHWIAYVPVNFMIAWPNAPRHHSRYGQWSGYLPGPVQDIQWDDEDTYKGSRGSASAISGSGAIVPDTRFVLKTPLGDDGNHT